MKIARKLITVVVALAWLGLPSGSGAVAASCKLHPKHVVNPGCVPATTSGQPGLPDLVPDVRQVHVFPEYTWDPDTQTATPGRVLFWFDTWAQNLGEFPVEMWADEPLNESHSTVQQCVTWTVTYVCRDKEPAGDFTWHEDHEHFHFNDFADYELRLLRPDGTIDYTNEGIVGLSEKVSFCLMDSQRTSADVLVGGTYASCSNTRQGISPGWSDVYGSDLPGQQFDLTGVADGTYALVIDMNTSANLRESDYSDNRVEVIVEISQANATAQIVEKRRPSV